MKTNSPLSTCGRKASCWLLLKRWTSSTTRIVPRPCACATRADSTASRISLTPPRTAETARNWASNPSAIRRASVVLPTPGGPQKIMECGRPDSKATGKGLPAPSRWRWPITSSMCRGRSRSASGAAGPGPVARSRPPSSLSRLSCIRRFYGCHERAAIALLADHIGTGRRFEAESPGRKVRAGVDRLEAKAHRAPEGIEYFHRPGQRFPETDPDVLEAGLAVARRRDEPLQAVCAAGIGQREVGIEPARAEQDRRRCRAHRLGHRPDRDLLAVPVVEPDLLAVGDHQLLVGPGDLPAKPPRPLESEIPFAAFDPARRTADGLLDELSLRPRRIGEKALECVDGAGGPCGSRAEREHGG